jgi:hypothetical protein
MSALQTERAAAEDSAIERMSLKVNVRNKPELVEWVPPTSITLISKSGIRGLELE